jgi:tripartite-type tricarboxylate transporter receptor subunit TctC
VNNKFAGGGTEGYRYAKDAKPDGRTIIWNATALLTLYHVGKLDFDHRAFEPVARITVDSLSLIVPPDAPWKDARGFVEYAKKNPGLKIGHEGIGTFAHLVAASLENAASIKLTHVESGAALQSIQAFSEKKIDVSSQAVAGIAGPAREGKVRILAVAGERRSPAFPDVPTFQEQGIPIAMDIWRGIGTPKGTPRARIAKLEAAFEQASKDPVFIEASKKYGFAIRYLSSADFGKFMNEDDRMLSGVLEKVGLKKQ